MTERILCVDDDPNIVQGYQRTLRKQFQIEAALGAEEALAAVRDRGPFAVVVADMRMPGINGVQLLCRLKGLAPDTVRMMLTGNADQQTALEAVNEGHIFRFLTKPCPPEALAKALEAGIAQHRLITAERDLISKTLGGSVRVLTDVLSLVNPTAFGRAARVRRLVQEMCRELALAPTWAIEIAAMLSQIGCVAVPEEVLAKVCRREPLDRGEQEALQSHPRVGRELIEKIPRLEEVALIIGYQDKLYDGGGFPADSRHGGQIPMGSRVLKVALDFDTLLSGGLTADLALAELHDRQGWYDAAVVAALGRVREIQPAHVVRHLRVGELSDGMILVEDVKSVRGTLLCARGQEVTSSMRARLKSYLSNVGVQGPIKVFVPLVLAGVAAGT